MNEKLKAAVLAAIQAYIEDEQSVRAAQEGQPNRWLRQGRSEALGAAKACFDRPRRWR